MGFRMYLSKFGLAVFLFTLIIGDLSAAGSTVNENFSLVKSLCDDMIQLVKRGNQDGFLQLADAALKLSEASRRDNSLAIDRYRPKIRAAKKAGKTGEIDKAIFY